MGLTCFISYCHDDNKRELLYFISELRKKIQSKSSLFSDIYFDETSNKVGDIITANEDKILEYNVVIPIFTVQYKEKAKNEAYDDTPKESGVRREYRKMLTRKETDQLCFVPILFSGDFETSVPEGFEQILYKSCENDSNWVRYDKTRSRYILTDLGKACVNDIALSIVDRANVNNDKKRFLTRDVIEQAEKTLLLDSNNTNAEAFKIPWECLVQLEVYKKFQLAQAAVIVGRKGSGKTTFLDALTTTEEFQGYNQTVYKKTIVIHSKNIPESSFYAFIQRIQKSSDKDLFSAASICDIFWEAVYGLQCVFSLWLEYSYNHSAFDGDSRKKTFINSIKKLRILVSRQKNISIDQTAPDDKALEGILHAVPDIIEEYYNSQIVPLDNPNASLFGYAVSSFTASNILKNFFGEDLYNSLYLALRQCNKKILIAIDAFDSYISEQFIPPSLPEEEKNSRQIFDSIFYKEAMITAEYARRKNCNNSNTYLTCCARFCILIPEDKFALITLIDRDAIKRNIIPLYWDAESLMEMLVKRLEYVYKSKTGIAELCDERTSVFEKFDKLLSLLYPNIPTKIEMNLNGTARKSIHLFNYMLRNSFWRPRDILCLFANIIACDNIMHLYSDSDERKQLMIKDAISDCVKNRIIPQEFFGEYIETYDNLSYYLRNSFKKCDLIMDIDKFMNILSQSVDLGYVNKKIRELQTNDKLRILYRMGVVGFYFSEKDIHHFSYGNCSCFFFNEGIDPLNEYLNNSFPEDTHTVKIIFNPILIKYLDLNTQGIVDYICDYDHQYIANNHRRHIINSSIYNECFGHPKYFLEFLDISTESFLKKVNASTDFALG